MDFYGYEYIFGLISGMHNIQVWLEWHDNIFIWFNHVWYGIRKEYTDFINLKCCLLITFRPF